MICQTVGYALVIAQDADKAVAEVKDLILGSTLDGGKAVAIPYGKDQSGQPVFIVKHSLVMEGDWGEAIPQLANKIIKMTERSIMEG